MIFEPRVRATDNSVGVGVRRENQHGVHTLFAVHVQADHRRVLHAGLSRERTFHVLGKHVQSLRRDDHLLLAAFDQQTSRLVDASDVARVKPAVLE